MKLSRLAGSLSAFALAAALALTGAGAAQAAPQAATPGYVALGDSYSAGLGAGSYYTNSGDCKRSSKSYPALWAAAHAPASFAFTACSGARTGDVLSKQLGPLNSSTGLVSLSIGGNDAGFADTMSTCVLSSDSACLERINQARTYVQNTLPGELDKVYTAIRGRAPAAHVVVLGYPRFYKLGTICAGLSETKRTAINSAADLLNSVIAKRVADHGFSYGDAAAGFSGHELCSGSPWLNSVTFPVDSSYHPNAAGQAGGYLPVFSSAA
ncbi:SGNH/GDSL hydrolase family protein [Streptomyces nondiastaticus]|uniref:SGNH/GDSL hydrolase family protein n=1 Tax=Streptomyces TaxID=1883 RepID=UPI002675B1DC|nr:SGNH/GDSL hydrolase family protein [Streptomyces sp. VNUA116]WKU44141.1 SGNH/GDSL hydrolase family protein [Streptomyces sp. VNUA116]